MSKSFKPQDDKLDNKLGTVVLKSVVIWRTNEAFTHLTVSSNLQVLALLSSEPHLGTACHPEKGNTTVWVLYYICLPLGVDQVCLLQGDAGLTEWVWEDSFLCLFFGGVGIVSERYMFTLLWMFDRIHLRRHLFIGRFLITVSISVPVISLLFSISSWISLVRVFISKSLVISSRYVYGMQLLIIVSYEPLYFCGVRQSPWL